MRNLIFILLALIAVWWVRRALSDFKRVQQRKRADEASRNTPERMVACAHCGLHVPESEGVREDERFYCSDAHRRLGVRR